MKRSKLSSLACYQLQCPPGRWHDNQPLFHLKPQSLYLPVRIVPTLSSSVSTTPVSLCLLWAFLDMQTSWHGYMSLVHLAVFSNTTFDTLNVYSYNLPATTHMAAWLSRISPLLPHLYLPVHCWLAPSPLLPPPCTSSVNSHLVTSLLHTHKTTLTLSPFP